MDAARSELVDMINQLGQFHGDARRSLSDHVDELRDAVASVSLRYETVRSGLLAQISKAADEAVFRARDELLREGGQIASMFDKLTGAIGEQSRQRSAIEALSMRVDRYLCEAEKRITTADSAAKYALTRLDHLASRHGLDTEPG